MLQSKLKSKTTRDALRDTPDTDSSSIERSSSPTLIGSNAYVGRPPPLDPKTERELRQACALILQDLKPSGHDIEDTRMKSDILLDDDQGSDPYRFNHGLAPPAIRVKPADPVKKQHSSAAWVMHDDGNPSRVDNPNKVIKAAPQATAASKSSAASTRSVAFKNTDRDDEPAKPSSYPRFSGTVQPQKTKQIAPPEYPLAPVQSPVPSAMNPISSTDLPNNTSDSASTSPSTQYTNFSSERNKDTSTGFSSAPYTPATSSKRVSDNVYSEPPTAKDGQWMKQSVEKQRQVQAEQIQAMSLSAKSSLAAAIAAPQSPPRQQQSRMGAISPRNERPERPVLRDRRTMSLTSHPISDGIATPQVTATRSSSRYSQPSDGASRSGSPPANAVIQPIPVPPIPVQPTFVQPTSVPPIPIQSKPVQPYSVQSAPVQRAPLQPTPAQPTPVQSALGQPTAIQQPIQPPAQSTLDSRMMAIPNRRSSKSMSRNLSSEGVKETERSPPAASPDNTHIPPVPHLDAVRLSSLQSLTSGTSYPARQLMSSYAPLQANEKTASMRNMQLQFGSVSPMFDNELVCPSPDHVAAGASSPRRANISSYAAAGQSSGMHDTEQMSSNQSRGPLPPIDQARSAQWPIPATYPTSNFEPSLSHKNAEQPFGPALQHQHDSSIVVKDFYRPSIYNSQPPKANTLGSPTAFRDPKPADLDYLMDAMRLSRDSIYSDTTPPPIDVSHQLSYTPPLQPSLQDVTGDSNRAVRHSPHAAKSVQDFQSTTASTAQTTIGVPYTERNGNSHAYSLSPTTVPPPPPTTYPTYPKDRAVSSTPIKPTFRKPMPFTKSNDNLASLKDFAATAPPGKLSNGYDKPQRAKPAPYAKTNDNTAFLKDFAGTSPPSLGKVGNVTKINTSNIEDVNLVNITNSSAKTTPTSRRNTLASAFIPSSNNNNKPAASNTTTNRASNAASAAPSTATTPPARFRQKSVSISTTTSNGTTNTTTTSSSKQRGAARSLLHRLGGGDMPVRKKVYVPPPPPPGTAVGHSGSSGSRRESRVNGLSKGDRYDLASVEGSNGYWSDGNDSRSCAAPVVGFGRGR